MKQIRWLSNAVILLSALTLGCLDTAWGARALEKPPVPDLTQGGKKDDSHDWLLGPTGARGWMFFRHEDLTAASRQILVTAVDAGSPADGILRVNDVILGVDGRPFAEDARRTFGHAITAAEEKTGALRLIRWRGGKTGNVDLKLGVLGTYSDTAPYNCPKSKAIFDQGCRLIAKKWSIKEVTEDNAIPNDLNALVLLASGKEEYRPTLAEYAGKVAASLHPDVWTWFYGYGNIFLAEYVLATGDQSVLPELKRTTMEVALGQSAVGTWGHGLAMPSGNLGGYGCMSQPGLPVTIALVLARQAGVNDPALDRAIEKSARFLRYYVNKGAIPYGDHQPGANVHEDNGKTSCAAVLFDLLGDHEAASFVPGAGPARRGFRADAAEAAGWFQPLRSLRRLRLCLSVMEAERWGEEDRVIPGLDYLKRYGKEANAVVPQLQETHRKLVKTNPDSKLVKLLNDSIAQIQSSKASPTLGNMKDFVAQASASGDASKNTKK